MWKTCSSLSINLPLQCQHWCQGLMSWTLCTWKRWEVVVFPTWWGSRKIGRVWHIASQWQVSWTCSPKEKVCIAQFLKCEENALRHSCVGKENPKCRFFPRSGTSCPPDCQWKCTITRRWSGYIHSPSSSISWALSVCDCLRSLALKSP